MYSRTYILATYSVVADLQQSVLDRVFLIDRNNGSEANIQLFNSLFVQIRKSVHMFRQELDDQRLRQYAHQIVVFSGNYGHTKYKILIFGHIKSNLTHWSKF
jgi:hypothetical protein